MILQELPFDKHLTAVWSSPWVELTAQPYHVHEVFGILRRERWKPALAHFSEKCIHVVSSEGRVQCTHFIQDAPQAPNVALVVIGLVLPHFRASVIRCTGLCL